MLSNRSNNWTLKKVRKNVVTACKFWWGCLNSERDSQSIFKQILSVCRMILECRCSVLTNAIGCVLLNREDHFFHISSLSVALSAGVKPPVLCLSTWVCVLVLPYFSSWLVSQVDETSWTDCTYQYVAKINEKRDSEYGKDQEGNVGRLVGRKGEEKMM